MKRLRSMLGVCSVALGMFCLTLPVRAEVYVARQMGANIPQDASNAKGLVAQQLRGENHAKG